MNRILLKTLTCLCFLIPVLSFGQKSCDKPDPLTDPYKTPQSKDVCYSPITNGFDDNWFERVTALGGWGSAGAKSSTRKRSVFVNQSINTFGAFAVIDNGPTSNDAVVDIDEVGSTFAVDEDGDCIYEREVALLDQLRFNGFDEIMIYNVSRILGKGSRNIISSFGKENNFNQMGVNKAAEWHLARFIHDARDAGFDVVAVMSDDIITQGNHALFYQYHLSWAEDSTLFNSYLSEIHQSFIDRYLDLWIHDPSAVTYKDYGEDTLFFPLDSEGRISDIDKYIVDLYNLAVFEFRLDKGFITAGNSSSPCSYDVPENCSNGFNGIIMEMEWWTNEDPFIARSEYLKLVASLQAGHVYRSNPAYSCFPSLYICQSRFDRPDDWGNNWTQETPQARANTLDNLADRIYLYAYQRIPCDAYYGNSNTDNNANADQNDWFVKASYLDNNPYQTDIYPVFNGKYYDKQRSLSTDVPKYYDDGKYGCDINKYGKKDCDYCNNNAGDALRNIPAGANANPNKLGYFENVWQEQYDFDIPNHTATMANNIHGYAWFKTSVIEIAQIINSNATVVSDFYQHKAYLYPNPSEGVFRIFGDTEVLEIIVVDLAGRTINADIDLGSRLISINQKGIFIAQIKTKDSVYSQKIISK